MSIAEKAYGPEHRDTGTAVNSLGGILLALGEHDQARAAFERAADIYAKALGPVHAYVAYPFANLGDVYRETGDFRRAVVHYQRSLEIREGAFGPVHRDVSVSSSGSAPPARSWVTAPARCRCSSGPST